VWAGHSHGIALEEVFEFPLSGRVGEVPDVQPTTLVDTDRSRIGLRGAVRVVDGGGCQGVGEVVGGSGHLDG
jgi:hypothetical protein